MVVGMTNQKDSVKRKGCREIEVARLERRRWSKVGV